MLVLWLHLGAVVVWLGGLCFLAVLLSTADARASLPRRALRRFRTLSGEALVLLVLTGLFNLINAGHPIGFAFGGAYLRVLVAKLALFGVMAGLQVWQSLAVWPHLAAGGEDHTGAPPDRVRQALRITLLNVALGFGLVFLGLGLRTL